MNRNVATNAFAARLEAETAVGDLSLVMEAGMALQTQLTAFATDEQVLRRGPVRVVAGDAAAHRDRRMLVDKWAVLLDVALGAGFVDVGRAERKARHVHGTVRVVAIGTPH